MDSWPHREALRGRRAQVLPPAHPGNGVRETDQAMPRLMEDPKKQEDREEEPPSVLKEEEQPTRTARCQEQCPRQDSGGEENTCAQKACSRG